MTGAPDETDAAFVERVAAWADSRRVDGERPISEGALDRLIALARAHAAPRTVQAAVTDAQAIQEQCAHFDPSKRRCLVNERNWATPGIKPNRCRLCPEAAASAPTAAPKRKAYAEGDWWVVGKGWTSADHITKPDLMPLSVVLQTPEPASPAACSCGGVAAIDFADEDVVAAMLAYDHAIYGEMFTEHDAMVDAMEAFIASVRSRSSTPCACYRAGIERAAEIVRTLEMPTKEWMAHVSTITNVRASFIAAFRRAGEEGSS